MLMRWVFFLPLLVLLALFALSNPQPVEVRLWPFDLAWAAPLGVAVLVLGAIAFLLGAAIAWSAGLPQRRRAARIEQAARLLEAELSGYRAREEQARREADLGRGPDAPALGGPR
jgi:uncharacterized integral membrane protein